MSVVVPVAVAKVIRVRVSGEIDSSTVDLLVRAIEPHLDISDAVIVVDLTEVTFLGTAGLRALERAEHHANRVGSELCLLTETTAVRRSLALLDMLRA
ncbi:STAS domain-containing protein [Lentzea rhizosphaerae]|uniref:STAS domain-containing protein n=1 Tax=Lentzea rhizosphaerae TaxID=2041025 RepID=A0ABV8C566_9PSEU